MAGVLCGAVMTGQLADLFGRRHILFIEHTILVTMWFCSAFAGTWMIYAVLRFVIGALIGGMYFSRTPDQDFCCFYHLSHIPVTARGKDKKGTAARRPHAGHMSIRDDVIVIL